MTGYIQIFVIKGLYCTYYIWACLPGFQQSETQTSLLSYRDLLENWNFTCSKFRYTFQKANNKGGDQTAKAGLPLYCSQTLKTGFLVS